MTVTGKCDICRARKVKCDEEKPKCGACRKRDRQCTYSYGKVTAFVSEDPLQLSQRKRTAATPAVYPIIEWQSPQAGSSQTLTPDFSVPVRVPDNLRIKATKDASDDQGKFMTFSTLYKDKPRHARKNTALQKRRLQEHLDRLRQSAEIAFYRPSSPEHTLAIRYRNILGHRSLKDQPLAILGSWVESIPSRIGSSPVVDLAVEYLADCYDFYRNKSFSQKSTALVTKAKALAQLQLAVGDVQTRATYDTILAMRIHFVSEILIGLEKLHHAIHGVALVEILREGLVAGVDLDHYWNFIDNTYLDDVSEALIAGRTTVFDNNFYLQATLPAAIPADTPATFRASITIMHIYIQLPRLVCLVRHAQQHPEDLDALELTIRLAEKLWSLDPHDLMVDILKTSTTIKPTPPAQIISDIVPDSIYFASVEVAMLLSRYWLLECAFCGVLERLLRHFPLQTASSTLPEATIIHRKDFDAAINLARSARYSMEVCPYFPVVPLRLHTIIQLSIASWRRLRLRLQESLKSSSSLEETLDLTAQRERAHRMEKWSIDEGNRVHTMWGVPHAENIYIESSVETITGGPIPDWLPTSVKFIEEDGELVMTVEYGISKEFFAHLLGDDEERIDYSRLSKTASPFKQDRLHTSTGSPPLSPSVWLGSS